MNAPKDGLSPVAVGHLKRARNTCAQGKFKQCVQACEAFLRVAPANHEILSLCGQAHLKLGFLDQAADCLKNRLDLDRNNSQIAEDIANILIHTLKYQEALPYLILCQSIRGWTEGVAYKIGYCHHALGNYSAALEVFQTILSTNPRMIDSYLRVALTLHEMRRYKESIDILELALTINPGSMVLLHCQATLLTHQGLLSAALGKYENIEKNYTLSIEQLIEYADLLARMRRGVASEKKYLEAIKLDPNHRVALTSYGALLLALKRYEEAMPLFEKILKIHPDCATTWMNLGNICASQRNFIRANKCYQKAYALNPRGAGVAGAYIYAMSFICDWKAHQEVMATIESDSSHTTSRTFPSVLYENNAMANLAYARSAIERTFNSTNILGNISPYSGHKKIRIGYYSSDFYQHATVMLIEGMLKAHDRNQFELFAFSLDFSKEDGYTDRIRGLFDHYHDVSRLSDGAVTLLSRQLEIDIAIDLKGFTEGSRTGIFIERAAPLQINYLGFPGSMGASFMDYMVADKYIINSENRKYFDEKIIYMPDCYQPNNPGRPSSGQGGTRPAELPAGKFVFCSFNNTHKLTPGMFDLWLRILKQAPESVLWMLKTTEQAEANLLAYVKAARVDESRIVFAPTVSEAEHLKRFAHADLFLDNFPCNAHTTASDALWSGVPIVTRSGQTFASRVAGSLLKTVGLQDLIVESEEAYEALALKIYHDRVYHQQLKQRVKDGIAHGPLYDAETYTRYFERALIHIYERQQEGLKPEDLDITQLQIAVMA